MSDDALSTDTLRTGIPILAQQLDEHLQAINENTTEIHALFDYLQDIERKLDRLSQRVDSLQLAQQELGKPIVSPLNHTERKIFVALYTEETPLCYREIAEKAHLPLSIIPECISTLASKGVPLERSFFQDQLFLRLDSKFREMQAKENLVTLSLQSFME